MESSPEIYMVEVDLATLGINAFGQYNCYSFMASIQEIYFLCVFLAVWSYACVLWNCSVEWNMV